jgi:hypothetical protein
MHKKYHNKYRDVILITQNLCNIMLLIRLFLKLRARRPHYVLSGARRADSAP